MAKKKTKSTDSSARIELSITEYNAMVDRISQLEEVIVKLEREKEFIVQQFKQSVGALDFLANAPLVHRVFKWKKTLETIDKSFD